MFSYQYFVKNKLRSYNLRITMNYNVIMRKKLRNEANIHRSSYKEIMK